MNLLTSHRRQRAAFYGTVLTLLLAALAPPAHAQSRVNLSDVNNRVSTLEGADKDAAGGQLIVNAATLAAQTAGSLASLTGVNFGNGTTPVVNLGGIALNGVSVSADGTTLTATLAQDYASGSYNLTVTTGTARTQFDAAMVTIGAVGATGPQGETGPPGPTTGLSTILAIDSSAGSSTISNLGDPVNATDAANRNYVDGRITFVLNTLGVESVTEFGGSTYFLIDELMQGDTAQARCQAFGANLASISSAAENALIPNICETCNSASNCRFLCWIGGNDKTTEGTLEWFDGTPVTFTNFVTPDGNDDATDCVSTTGNASFRAAGLWEYERCANVSVMRVAICEK